MPTRPPCDEAIKEHFSNALQLGLAQNPELTGATVLFSWRPGLEGFLSLTHVPKDSFSIPVLLNMFHASIALQRQLVEQLHQLGVEMTSTLDGLATQLAQHKAAADARPQIEQR